MMFGCSCAYCSSHPFWQFLTRDSKFDQNGGIWGVIWSPATCHFLGKMSVIKILAGGKGCIPPRPLLVAEWPCGEQKSTFDFEWLIICDWRLHHLLFERMEGSGSLWNSSLRVLAKDHKTWTWFKIIVGLHLPISRRLVAYFNWIPTVWTRFCCLAQFDQIVIH